MKNLLSVLLIAFPVIATCQHFGQSDHAMNKDTENREILNYWAQKSNLTNKTYDAAMRVLSAHREADFSALMKDREFRELATKSGLDLLGGPILGDVTENSISIWIRTLEPSSVAVVVTAPGFRRAYAPVFSSIESDLSAVLKVGGLKPSTVYSYQLFVNEKPVGLNTKTVFKTASNDRNVASRIAFGTCPHRWGLGNQKLFESIQQRSPEAFLLYGDIAVQDRNGHFGLHRADYLLRDFHPAWKNFAASIPVYTSWDDHDYFDNDKSGIPSGYSDVDRKKVREVFRYSWNNPSYGFEEQQQGIFTRTRVGAFDIIMTDNRFFRDKASGQFLGRPQMDWLKQELLSSTAPFIVLTCGTMWSDYVSEGKDSWGEYDPEGREELFRWIEENNIKGVLLLSGDRHGARGFTIPRKSGFHFYEFEPASLGARVGPPAKKASWETQLFGIDGEFAFGEFTFVPSDHDPGVIFRLIKEDGTIYYELKLKRSQLTPGNFD